MKLDYQLIKTDNYYTCETSGCDIACVGELSIISGGIETVVFSATSYQY